MRSATSQQMTWEENGAEQRSQGVLWMLQGPPSCMLPRPSIAPTNKTQITLQPFRHPHCPRMSTVSHQVGMPLRQVSRIYHMLSGTFSPIYRNIFQNQSSLFLRVLVKRSNMSHLSLPASTSNWPNHGLRGMDFRSNFVCRCPRK